MKTFPPLPCHQRSDRVHLDVIPTEVVGVLGGCFVSDVGVGFVVVVVWLLAGVSWGVVEGFGIVEVLLGNWLGQVGIEAGSCPGQALTRLSGCVSCGAGTGCWGRRTI